jgi:hypothetical protein
MPRNKTRKEMIADMMWLAPDLGHGFGICSFAASLIWGDQKPTEKKPDWKSVVFVKGPEKKYTLEEIKKLCAFSQSKTADYDRLFSVRMGCNIIIISKEESCTKGKFSWLRKRITWESGPMYSKTLDEAIATFLERKN